MPYATAREWIWAAIAVTIAATGVIAAVVARGGDSTSAALLSFFAALIGSSVALVAATAALSRPAVVTSTVAGIVDVAVLVYWLAVVLDAISGAR